ncbi:MAG TPA: T9SS type A sorting domain-containing protein [Rubricoccaceae bacterium]|nr:T9SS type A sorting domain-containing protein [Rubricoccaceae bacterium]
MRLLPFSLVSLALLATPPRAQGGPPFARTVAPFPVLDAAGAPYPYPFAGGFLQPRPDLADLDGDGDADLLVVEENGPIGYYERVGAGGPGFGFAWRTDRLGDIHAEGWARFGDLDGDGDLDLLTQRISSRVRYWRNDGTPAAPAFVLAADPHPTLTIEDTSIPALTDIDADGDLDFFHGQADRGHVTFFRHDGVAGGIPQYTFVTSDFEGIEVYDPNPTCNAPDPLGAARHGANALTFADLDADADPDFFWGDFFTRSLFYYRNTGSPADPAYAFVSNVFPLDEPLTSGGYNVPTFGDVDEDGDPDLLIGIIGGLCATSANWDDNLFFYENVGTPADEEYTLRTGRLIASADVGSRSAVALTDLDGDGDLDLVAANEADPDRSSAANLVLFQNDGTPNDAALRLADPDWLALDYEFGGYGPTFGDLDTDGDPDLFVGSFNGRLAFLRNDGTPTAPAFTLVTEQFEEINVGQFMRPALGDLDGDGDLDLVTGEANGRVKVYRNAGTPQAPDFPTDAAGAPTPADTLYRRTIGLPFDVGDGSAPALGDVDGDGDLDALIGTAAGEVRYYRNDGSPTAPTFVAAGSLPPARLYAAPALGDFDGDTDDDLVAGTFAGGFLYYANTRVPNPEPNEPGPPTPSARLDVFPNPSAGGVTFRFGAEAARRALVVYDVLGREVGRLDVPPGAATLTWQAPAALPVGTYLVRLADADGRRLAMTRLQLVR